MKKCEICGVEHTRKSKYCSGSCYYKNWYKEHREERLEYSAKKHKESYVPHPKVLKYKTKEERHKAKVERSREYRKMHPEECRKKSAEYYKEHKNDKHFKERHSKAMKRYYEKRKEERAKGIYRKILEESLEYYYSNGKKYPETVEMSKYTYKLLREHREVLEHYHYEERGIDRIGGMKIYVTGKKRKIDDIEVY